MTTTPAIEIPDDTVELVATLTNRAADGDLLGAVDEIAGMEVDTLRSALAAAVAGLAGEQIEGATLEALPVHRFVELPDVRTWVRSDLIGGVRVVTTPDGESDVVVVLAASASGEELGRVRVNAGEGEELARRLLAEAQG